METFTRLTNAPCWRTNRWANAARFILALTICLGWAAIQAVAQTGGSGAVTGTVTDATGAVIANATITATNVGTGIVTTRQTSSAGYYNITPLLPGTYAITVSATGFEVYKQENVAINAMAVLGLDVILKPGSEMMTVTVTDAPPVLETSTATLGGVMENKLYANLPILMDNQQRDPTAFAVLLPGSQSGSRAPIIGGTSNYSAELYLDGVPVTVATQQGDNRVIFNAIPVEAIEQFQVLTSSIPPEYQGAGLLNFTIKSGTNMYHGSANMYLRNTVFDTWTYLQKRATNSGYDDNGNPKPPKKPYENQNELAVTAGGPIPLTHHKGFFQYTFDRYHGRSGVNPGLMTIPTTKMRTGDFSEWLKINGGPGYIIYDPLSQATCTANNGHACRYAYGQSYTGAPTADETQVTNVIPDSQISSIAKYMQSFLPPVSNSSITNNYLGGLPSGYDNWSFVGRVDYDMTPNQRISAIWSKGSRLNTPYTFSENPTLPMPYAHVSEARIIIDLANIEHTWAIKPSLVNQFKFGLLYFGGPPVKNATEGITKYEAVTAGITNLPAGQASDEFPGAQFGQTSSTDQSKGDSYGQHMWTNNGASGATYSSRSLGYTYGDNLQWLKGKHSFAFGFQYQFLEANASTYDGNSGVLTTTYTKNPTSLLTSSTSTTANTGYYYASYLLGGIGTMATTIQSFGVTGGRYHPFAPYAEDNWKITPKLTLNLGVRWDYLPPYHEAQDRFSFLNPNLTNTITGNLGMVQFAGHHGAGVSCECSTPVKTYWKNWGPRLGLAYEVNDKTVIHAGFGLFYSHGGGVGGRSGAASGTGQLGYTTTASISETTATPAFWLNDSSAFATAGLNNTAFGGPDYTLPVPTGATAAGQVLNTGNYVSNGAYVAANSVTYADPYVSGRAPTFAFFNFGVQRALRNSTTISVNYSGSESHFLLTGSSATVGKWANQIDPKYMVGLATTKAAKGANIMSSAATSANVAIAQAAMPSITVPYTGYTAAAALSSKATIQQMLTAFPQYSGVSNIWGQNVGNNSYHSLQLSLIQRDWKGLNFQLSYTFSKNLGDDGTYRSGYDIPADAIDGGKAFKRGRADRSWTALSVPQSLNIFGVYESPFGKGKIGSNNFLTRSVAGGWLLSGIFKYNSGHPMAILATTNYAYGGSAMPDLNPDYGKKSARIGKWAIDSAQHIDPTAFIGPTFYGTSSTCTTNCTSRFGNAPRTRAYNLSAPSSYNLDMGLKRTFPITRERFKLQLEANCLNVTHKHTFGGIGTTLPSQNGDRTFTGTSGSFGMPTTASGNRDFQFAGHIIF
jgi:hypothetical protein